MGNSHVIISTLPIDADTHSLNDSLFLFFLTLTSQQTHLPNGSSSSAPFTLPHAMLLVSPFFFFFAKIHLASHRKIVRRLPYRFFRKRPRDAFPSPVYFCCRTYSLSVLTYCKE
ncbi:hypothetical protein SODALDRAFT_205965 [Sodiomyces alkalinus F11]|uniref:Uncharacterized protein n=1 Tax=Sodiomyces alkalinus (strain CBS 110278 / VKM F-3762 / F11) TaxID=1314773 RepID=A0A3N2PQJ5_SODAK|nr:hypothetical protein SODALDRAFT_205965 [Sodiomyces alkalinus F11]ROT36734.1 hypothetical protein SODALDRAFT_205965 [Sodiomyces alkalinus F11]